MGKAKAIEVEAVPAAEESAPRLRDKSAPRKVTVVFVGESEADNVEAIALLAEMIRQASNEQ